ncbi:hypothetical protein MHYP_G00228120 [Metynnis hypsauchen]
MFYCRRAEFSLSALPTLAANTKEESSKGKVLSSWFTVGELQMFAAFTVMSSNKYQPHASKLHELSIHHFTKKSHGNLVRTHSVGSFYMFQDVLEQNPTASAKVQYKKEETAQKCTMSSRKGTR